jgi:hypothetical protein
MKKLASKIVSLLERHGIRWPGGPENAVIVRTRAGHWQRSAGAWSWFLLRKDGETCYPSVGSQYPASELIKGDVDITIEYGSYVLDLVQKQRNAP